MICLNAGTHEERVVICCVNLVWYSKSIKEVQERVTTVQVEVGIANRRKSNTLQIIVYSHWRIVDIQSRDIQTFLHSKVVVHQDTFLCERKLKPTQLQKKFKPQAYVHDE